MVSELLAGLAVLVIGDSHLSLPTYLIRSLHDGLVQQGAQVHSIAACGVTAGDWVRAVPATCGAERVGKEKPIIIGKDAKTTPIKDLVAADQAKLVIVVMGDTMAGYKQDFPKVWIWQQVTALTKEIAKTGASCLWVGPAWGTEGGSFGKNFARAQQLSNFLASTVAPCEYIDSLKFSKQGQWPTSDGQHFTAVGYDLWGSEIVKSALASTVVKNLTSRK
ncbi:MAG: SGNH/GDSL hydrolase family protein [Alcaligenaceae bacterium]